MAVGQTRTINVVYCYAKRDHKHLKDLVTHLATLRQANEITEWYGGEIPAGKDIDQEVDDYFDRADLVLLLISPYFIDSDYCYHQLSNRALQKHNARAADAISILLYYVTGFEDTPLAGLKKLPNNHKPIMDWPKSRKAFESIADEIRTIVHELQGRSIPFALTRDVSANNYQKIPVEPLAREQIIISRDSWQTSEPEAHDDDGKALSPRKLETPDAVDQDAAIELDQVCYSWPTIDSVQGFNPTLQLRACSQGFTDEASERAKALKQFISTTLPDWPSDTEHPDEVSTSLAFLLIGNERVLLHTAYHKEQDVGKPPSLFIHLFTGLPDTFSAADAILYWDAHLWQTSDVTLPAQSLILRRLPINTFKQLWHQNSKMKAVWLKQYLPLIIQAFFVRQEQQRIYIVAPPEMIVGLIFGLTNCIPSQLLTSLTFNTYVDVTKKQGNSIIVGTSWQPTSASSQASLQNFAVSYGEDQLIINCYTQDQPDLQNVPADVSSFAAFATQCLVSGKRQKLDALISYYKDIDTQDAMAFLQLFSLMVTRDLSREGILAILRDLKLARAALRMEHVQHAIIEQSDNEDVQQALEALLRENIRRTTLRLFMQQISNEVQRAIQQDEYSKLEGMLKLFFICDPAARESEVWSSLLTNLLAVPNALYSLRRNEQITFSLLQRFANTPKFVYDSHITDQMRPLLYEAARNLDAFRRLKIPAEWQVMGLLSALIANVKLPANIGQILQRYPSLVEEQLRYLMEGSSRERRRYDAPIRYIDALMKYGYSRKVPLLAIVFQAESVTSLFLEALDLMPLNKDESIAFLTRYGPDILYHHLESRVLMGYIQSFTLELKFENLEDPSVIELLGVLSNSNNRMAREMRELAQDWNTIAKFVQQPLLDRNALESLAQAIVSIDLRQHMELLKKLAPSFTPLITNDFDLLGLLEALNTTIEKSELFELLLTMSSIVGQMYSTQRSESLLIPYLRIACESRASDSQPDIASLSGLYRHEQAIYQSILLPKEGTDLLLRTLLWYANSATYELLNIAIQDWPYDVRAKWRAYAPQERVAATTEILQFSLIGRLKRAIILWNARRALKSRVITKIAQAARTLETTSYNKAEFTSGEQQVMYLATLFSEACSVNSNDDIVDAYSTIQSSSYRSFFEFTGEEQERIRIAIQQQ